ncbi:MAG: DNA-3-methyladenine glycosylase I [Eubacteriales bacterium]|nr:DNA-3-methyladenine glycosylase I [Eubacteriales bacterium]
METKKEIPDNRSLKRCEWPGEDLIYQHYHDTEWGIPSHNDRYLYEMLILEGAQAGLSWLTILKRREGYREVFDYFDWTINMKYTDEELFEKLKDERIIRNRLKVFSVRSNAKIFQEIINEFGSFSSYLWAFVDNKPIMNRWKTISEVPATSEVSDKLSQDLKKRGFKFAGSTICYAYMQAVGLVNDHIVDCFLRTGNKKGA